MNLARLLARAGRSTAELPAVAVDGTTRWDYAELSRRAAALASGLRGRLRLAAGDRVALLMANHAAYTEVLFACWWAGLAAVPVNAKLHPQEIRYILEHSGARALFVTPGTATASAEAGAGLAALAEIVDVESDAYARLLQSDTSDPAPAGDGELAWLFYTSGTTGRPKGAMLTHGVLRAMSLSYFIDVDTVRPGETILHAAPMSHGSGLYIVPHVAASACQAIPQSGGFDPDEILTLLPQHPGTTMFAAPTMVRRLIAHDGVGAADTGNLKTIVYGGGPMYVADLKQGMEVLGRDRFVQIYGQGESPMTITALTRHDHLNVAHPSYESRLASAGREQTVVEVAVIDADGRPLPPGETGEIVARGTSVMPGYWNDPDSTAKTLRDGWLFTGDIGVLDGDGFLTLKDRSKDVIITGGTNVYPREVEEVLLRHPAVAEVSVVGEPHADWGERVVAFVVPEPGRAGEATAETLDGLCLAEIARFKRPRRWEFLDALPKNAYGKVLKTELRARLDAAE